MVEDTPEEELDECRICRGGAESMRPLFHPCRCSGSIRFTHEDCLIQWLTQSGASRCELCQHQFRFEREYHPEAPRKLSAADILVGVLWRLRRMVRSAARILLVLIVWIFFLPVGTCWTWHAVFLESPTDILPFVTNRGLLDISVDALYGCILSAGIVLIFFGVSSFWEYLRNVPELTDDQGNHYHLVGDDAHDIIAHDNIRAPNGEIANYMEENEADDVLQMNINNAAGLARGEHDAGVADENDFVGVMEFDAEEAPFEPLEEVIGLRGPIRNLFDNAGTVLVSNAILLVVFALVPLLVGRLTQRLYLNIPERPLSSDGQPFFGPHNDPASSDNSQKQGNLLTILIGYAVISFFVTIAALFSSALRSRYPRLNTPLTRQVMRFLLHVGTFLKVVIFIVFEFFLFPLGCGWMLDACMVRFVNSSFVAHVQFFQVSPWTSTAMHWLLGIIYMMSVSLSASLLSEVLRPELLWFIRNPDDPDFHPFREIVEKSLSYHARRMCLSVLIYAPLILLLVFLPLNLCSVIFWDMFPLHFKLGKPLLDIPMDMLLIHVLFVPLSGYVQYSHPRALLRFLFRSWMGWIGDQLGIRRHILKDNHRDEDLQARADDSAADGEPTVQDDEHVSHFRVRMTCILVLTWAVLVLSSCFAIVAPCQLGRSVFNFFRIPVEHDVYTFCTGFLILWIAIEGFLTLHNLLAAHPTEAALKIFASKAKKGVKGVIIGLLWTGVIPLLMGISLENFCPQHIRSAFADSTLQILYQDWAAGLVLHKTWIILVLSERFEAEGWIERLEILHNGGLAQIDEDFGKILRSTILPVLRVVGRCLIWPFFASKVYSLVKLSWTFRGIPVHTSPGVEYVYFLSGFGFLVIAALMKYLRRTIVRLHDSIRDDKYLAGIRLQNYDIPQSNGSSLGEASRSVEQPAVNVD